MSKIIDDVSFFVQKAKCIKSELISVKKAIDNYNSKFKATKTIAKTGSIIGGTLTVVAFGASFFTGGLSLVTLAGTGFVTSLVSGGTAFGLEGLDYFKSRKFLKKIYKFTEELDELSNELKSEFNKIYLDAKEISSELNKSDEEAFIIVLYKLFSKDYSELNNARKNQRILQVLFISNCPGNFILKTDGKTWQGIRIISKQIAKILAKLGYQIGKRTAINLAKTATVAFSGFFLILDIKELIDTLKNDHPTSEKTKQVLEKIDEIISEM
ncbi:unnamed protein product, partial [Brachionus calyciflorus]